MAQANRSVNTTIQAKGARFLIVEARFYDGIGAMLLEGAQAALAAASADWHIISLPGALEIPAAIAMAWDAPGSTYAGVIALGCIIRGETYHFEIVASQSARALMDLAVARQLALGNGILTVENDAQAVERANPLQGDKGGDAARAALALYALKRNLGTI